MWVKLAGYEPWEAELNEEGDGRCHSAPFSPFFGLEMVWVFHLGSPRDPSVLAQCLQTVIFG